MSEHLIESHDGGVATLTMNRPEARNAMSGAMMEAMQSALPRLAADRSVRAIVLTGAGGAFCAGGDVKGFRRGRIGRRRRVQPGATRAWSAHRHGTVALAARNAEADARSDSRSRRRRGSVAGARVRSARRGRYREVHHRVLEDRSGGRLRRFVLPAASRRRGEGARAVLHRRRDLRAGSVEDRPDQPRVSGRVVRSGRASLSRASSRTCRRSRSAT